MKLDLKAIEERCEKATPGPWINTFDNPPHPEFGYGISQSATSYPHAVICLPHPNTGRGTFKPSRETANFIAHARTDIPALLAFAKEAKDALEFYSHKENWETYIGGESNYAMIKKDQETLPWATGFESDETYIKLYNPTKYVGGKKARAVLTKWFGKEGEK